MRVQHLLEANELSGTETSPAQLSASPVRAYHPVRFASLAVRLNAEAAVKAVGLKKAETANPVSVSLSVT
ncbi:hypothetical protein DDT54_20865 [Brenneria nigrifluens DSM 30175 = ATCC 13028]|uniref:Uncharacterized protein n=1 Tax=Brenneria nigrifluens DSM 30175 = ATCC 13028 TaxID=1121120 RepID=A0A2U1UFD2_9GAMM|nr:hypothetical protein DDT54_20865 [Brenneria nigrifluens DSM 30175 = ATCC 13028]